MVAYDESKSILDEFPKPHWSSATGHCINGYLSATMLNKVFCENYLHVSSIFYGMKRLSFFGINALQMPMNFKLCENYS